MAVVTLAQKPREKGSEFLKRMVDLAEEAEAATYGNCFSNVVVLAALEDASGPPNFYSNDVPYLIAKGMLAL